MKNSLFILLLCVICFPALAQPIVSGLVREQNSNRRPLGGVQIEFEAATPAVSDDSGRFHLVFQEKKNGDPIFLIEIKKDGYELVNGRELAQLQIDSTGRLPVDIILAKTGAVEAAREEYYELSAKALDKTFEQKKQELQSKIQNSVITQEEFEARLSDLQQEFEGQKFRLDDLAGKFAIVNFDDAADIYKDALELLKIGLVAEAMKRIDHADSLHFIEKGELIPESAGPGDIFSSLPNTGNAAAGFIDLLTLDSTILLDIRYATTNNFTQSKIYDCPRCLLRPEAAKAIVQAHQKLKKQGLRLKMFDCYRPRPYQQRLWDKVPNPDYVTPPAKGSMHSRGAAVDLTIVDATGKELDMGTEYDFFGPKAHTDYTKLPGKVLANRRLLRSTLEASGFQGIRTEWWHFSYRGKNFPLSDFVWECGGK